jgi:hypothetical protein
MGHVRARVGARVMEMLQVIGNELKRRNGEAASQSTAQDTSCLEGVSWLCLAIDVRVADNFQLNVFSHDARLVLQLLRKPRLIIKDAWLSSRLSSRAFHELVKRMQAGGIVDVTSSEVDRRTKSIGLTTAFRARFLSQLRAAMESGLDLGGDDAGGVGAL